MNYDFSRIERKWQKIWKKEGVYEPDLDVAIPRRARDGTKARKPFYNLMLFPYPSAEGLHVGNMYAFTGSDIYGRFKRMQGNDVLEPIGLDGFGIHSENYALKIGAHPMEQSAVSEERFYKQLEAIGNGFAWDEHLETYDPEYYRWTQWIFTQMWKRGLAYRKKQAVNWCPSCKTVLADEQVIAGKCERCGTAVIKKELEQWFFKITDYAERMLNNIDGLDWSERVKIAQRNWIGKSEGALITFVLNGIPGQDDGRHSVAVFTTRPDTLFGVTFIAISADMAKTWLDVGWKASAKVKKYVDSVFKERLLEKGYEKERDKTGVAAGVMAVNPATGEEVPVWITNYVMGDVGTGAVMGVPAHDERDFAFAKKYKLPIRGVVEPIIIQSHGPDAVRNDIPFKERDAVVCIVKHWSENKYLCLQWKKIDWRGFVVGGIEKNEDMVTAGKREVEEETGYSDLRFIKNLGGVVHSQFFHVLKNENRWAHFNGLYFELKSGKHAPISDTEEAIHDVLWLTPKEIKTFLNAEDMHILWQRLSREWRAYEGVGILENSGKFDGMDSEKAKWEITKFVHGKRTTQYRVRDWLISRQRYWGAPIPMIYCSSCAAAGKGEQKAMPGWYAVPERDLPVTLPFVKDFRPRGKGESPLASVTSFYEVGCPKCGHAARRETDVSDTFLDSAWYFLRYPDVANKRAVFDVKRIGKWLPVDMYVGGAEHSVLHLLYARFMTMVFRDWGLLAHEEPFTKFRAHGLLIKDGAKMSKSKGNVVNPDEYIKKFGADVLRTYLMFLAPFEQGGDFRDSGIVGVDRFLQRVWKLSGQYNPDATNKKLEKVLHQTIKKVTEDIEQLHYNTAVSALMILLNECEKDPAGVSVRTWEDFLKLLAPFAPHMTEEIWRNTLGHKKSIHQAAWPAYDATLITEDVFTLIIQINGKVRATVDAPTGIAETQARTLALTQPRVQELLGTHTPKRVIYIPGRLVNIVI